MLCIAITISKPTSRVAIPRTTVHVVNDDLQPGQKVMFKLQGAPRKRQGTVIGRDTAGRWQIEGARQANAFHPQRFTLPREQVWTTEEHEAQKRQPSGILEATSSHGRQLTIQESNRRAVLASRNLRISEDEILRNPRILESARATLAALAAMNDLDSSFIITGSTLRNDDPEAMTLFSEYATAALTNLRGLAATATPEEIQDFRAHLAGKDIQSRIAYNIHRTGRTAVVRYLKRQNGQIQDREYNTTHEDDGATEMRHIAAAVAHPPYHESDLARKIARDRAIERQLQKMDSFEADLIRRKFALGNYDQEQSNEQIARELGDTWNRYKVGTAVKEALLKFARMEGTETLRRFLKD